MRLRFCSLFFSFGLDSKNKITRLHYKRAIQSMNLQSQSTPAKVIHFNHAGASPSPQSVLNTMVEHLKLEQNVGGYAAAEMASDKLQMVYEQIAKLLHVDSPHINASHQIALVESGTVGWTRLFYSMAQYQYERRKGKQSVILISEAEYAANVVAACKWAQEHPSWTVLSIPSSTTKDGLSTGVVDLSIFQKMLNGGYNYKSRSDSNEMTLDPSDIAMVCITHIPTNSGIVNPVADIGEQIDDYNRQQQQLTKDGDTMPAILYLVDACQSIGQIDLHADHLSCHGLVATGRKFLRGPRGTAFLYVPKHIANRLLPHHIDHFAVPIATVPPMSSNPVEPVESLLDMKPKEGAARFEWYESSIAGKLGLGEAVRYAIEEIGIHRSETSGQKLAFELFYQRLKGMDEVQLYHPPGCGIVTFHVPGIESRMIKQQLWDGEPQIETSLVPATSTPMDSARTQVPNLVRVSFSYTNTMDDIDALCKKLIAILK